MSEEILDFWQNLVNVRETRQIFTQGIKISNQLNEFLDLFSEIERKQSDKESKIYLQMASFYENVVFKSSECFLMIEKARQASQMRKLAIENREKESHQEKCLLMVAINLKKPMRITFINKTAIKLLQYTMGEALELYINALMPTFISEVH